MQNPDGNFLKERGKIMIKVKTFASPLKIFQTKKELEELDAMVNKFIFCIPPEPIFYQDKV
jgi:hypothetical protein